MNNCQSKRNNGIITPKDPQKRYKFRKFMKGLHSKRKLLTLSRAKTQYDLYKTMLNARTKKGNTTNG